MVDLRTLTTELKQLIGQLKRRCTNAEARVTDLQRQIDEQQQKIERLEAEKAELETGFYRWLERICRMGEQLGCRVDFHGHPATQHDLETYIHSAHPNVRFMFVPLADWNDLLIVTENLSFDHLFVLVSARRGSLSWQPSFDNLPAQLMKYFSNNSLMIIYPEQYDSAQEPTFAQPFI